MSMRSVAAIASANAPSYPSLGWLRHWPRPYDAVPRGRGTYPERLLCVPVVAAAACFAAGVAAPRGHHDGAAIGLVRPFRDPT